MSASTNDRIEREITLAAPRARVWKALTDHEEFGQWFGVKIEKPFEVGQEACGQITHPGFEHMTLRTQIEAMEAESRFVFRWQPHAVDPTLDTTGDPYTTIEFALDEDGDGTRLRVCESGFAEIPEEYREDCIARNSQGWTAQMQNIERHVSGD